MGMLSKALQVRRVIVAWADRASYWIFVILLGYISLVPFYYLQPLSLERISFHFFKFLPFLFCVFLMATRLIAVRRWGEIVDKTDWAIGVYLLFCCLSLVGADYPAIGTGKLFYYSVTGVGMFYIGRSFDAGVLYKILRWVACFGGVVAVYGLISYLTGVDFLWGQWYDSTHYYGEKNRLSSMLGNPIILGGFICLTAPILFGEALIVHTDLRRALLLTGVVTAAISLVLTISRSAWIAAIFMIALRLGLSRHWRIAAKKSIQAGIGVVVIALLVEPVVNRMFPGNIARTATYIGDRVASTRFEDANIRGRLKLFEIAAAEIASQPLAGLGFGNFTRVFTERHQRTYQLDMGIATQIHTTENMYLMFAVETGVVSLAAVLFFWYKRLAGLHRVFSTTQDRQQRLVLLAVFVGVCGFLLQILVWDGLNQPATRILFWSLLGAACGIARDYSRPTDHIRSVSVRE